MNILVDNLQKEILYLIFDFLKEVQLTTILLVDKKFNNNVYCYIRNRKFNILNCCKNNRIITMRLLHNNNCKQYGLEYLASIMSFAGSYELFCQMHCNKTISSNSSLINAASGKNYNIIDFITKKCGYKKIQLYSLIEGGAYAGDKDMINYVLSHKSIATSKLSTMGLLKRGLKGAGRGRRSDIMGMLINHGLNKSISIQCLADGLLIGACIGGSVTFLKKALVLGAKNIKIGLKYAGIYNRHRIICFALKEFPETDISLVFHGAFNFCQEQMFSFLLKFIKKDDINSYISKFEISMHKNNSIVDYPQKNKETQTKMIEILKIILKK